MLMAKCLRWLPAVNRFGRLLSAAWSKASGTMPSERWIDGPSRSTDGERGRHETARPEPGSLAAPGEGADGRTSWLLCRTGPHMYAVPLEHVIECMRVLPIDAIRAAPQYVRGLSIIRGSPVPVVDPGVLLNDAPTRSERLVTIRAGARTVALLAEAVLGIRWL